jgi:hypothetical protein
MRTRMPALAIIALLGLSTQATAQTPCPELARLRGEVAEALKLTTTVPTSERCAYYNRFATASVGPRATITAKHNFSGKLGSGSNNSVGIG